MDFKQAAKLGSILAKDYAEDIFRLLANYHDVSASEAASRLNLHIKTAQEFLETMASLGILHREEVYEKKRPYNRYRLKTDRIHMDIDLGVLKKDRDYQNQLSRRIKEKKNAGARFTTARNFQAISSVIIWSGTGRDRRERRINLTMAQGKFLFHLPFPTAPAVSIREIMDHAGVSETHVAEVMDLVALLQDLSVIEYTDD